MTTERNGLCSEMGDLLCCECHGWRREEADSLALSRKTYDTPIWPFVNCHEMLMTGHRTRGCRRKESGRYSGNSMRPARTAARTAWARLGCPNLLRMRLAWLRTVLSLM